MCSLGASTLFLSDNAVALLAVTAATHRGLTEAAKVDRRP